MDYASVKNKRGIGIMEALVSSVVLGFLLVALFHLQNGNRENILRIRGRDGAVAVAHDIIDSLNAVGLASVEMPKDESGNSIPIVLQRSREWKGKPGILEHSMNVVYTIVININDEHYRSGEHSDLRTEEHIYAKRLDVRVEWPFKNSTQSISMTGVIR